VRRWFSSKAAAWILCATLLAGISIRAGYALAQGGVHNCRFASIHYQEPGQLDRLAQKIQPAALTVSLNQIFMGSTRSIHEAKAGRYVDQLFQRVQAVLEMPKHDMKVQIRLYRDQADLSAAFEQITARHTQAPAFYWKETNAIYLNLERISVGILAHEMAHAVIAHYFIISPPEKVSELLCQYVDREVSKGTF
jgi:hypothetical protein